MLMCVCMHANVRVDVRVYVYCGVCASLNVDACVLM